MCPFTLYNQTARIVLEFSKFCWKNEYSLASYLPPKPSHTNEIFWTFIMYQVLSQEWQQYHILNHHNHLMKRVSCVCVWNTKASVCLRIVPGPLLPELPGELLELYRAIQLPSNSCARSWVKTIALPDTAPLALYQRWCMNNLSSKSCIEITFFKIQTHFNIATSLSLIVNYFLKL